MIRRLLSLLRRSKPRSVAPVAPQDPWKSGERLAESYRAGMLTPPSEEWLERCRKAGVL